MKRHSPQRSKSVAPRGSILVVVVVVIAMMTVAGMAYFEWTFTERRASQLYGRQLQTRALADSGVELARALLTRDPQVIQQEGGLYVNPNWFQGYVLADNEQAALRARVSLVAPLEDYGDYVGYRFGLENESSRLNLNTLLLADNYVEDGARNQLMSLPGMTESIADAILDWIDEDDDVRPFGAELTYYSSLEFPLTPQNGPLECLEQLLLVRDVTPQLLFGLDTNRNHVVDGAEALTQLPPEVDNSNGEMNRGWAAYLTLYSAEANLNPDGEAKINVNMEDLEELHSALSSALGTDKANFIVAYRQGGAADEDSDLQTVSPSTATMDYSLPGSETIGSLLDLIGVNVEFSDNGQASVMSSPFPAEPGAARTYLPELLDELTVSAESSTPGRLNINQAPRVLLYGVPNLPPEVVEQIIASRVFDPATERPDNRHAEWLYMDGLLPLEAMKAIAPLVTGGGDVYRVQSVGFFEADGPATRIEAVLDATQMPPSLLMRRDLTPLGAGYTALELIGEQDPAMVRSQSQR